MFENITIQHNDFKALDSLKIEPSNVKVLTEAFFRISKSDLDKVSQDSNRVEMLANFKLFVQSKKDEDLYYAYNIKTNVLLNIKFHNFIDEGEYRYFLITPGSDLFESNFIKNDVATAFSFFNQLMAGKFNKVTPSTYGELLPTLMKIMDDNEIGGHASIEFELLFSELVRSASDESVKFRTIGKETSLPILFSMSNVRDVPRTQSPFAAISSENIQKGVIKMLNTADAKSTLSPMEQIALGKSQ